jgi:precorrin-6B methylase 2
MLVYMKVYKLRGGLDVQQNKIFLTEDELNEIYKNLTDTTVETGKFGEKKDFVESTYGEITYPSVQELIKRVRLGPQDIFIDLGSGNGKVVMQVFSNSGVKKAYGVEFFPERSLRSEKALKNLYKLKPNLLSEDRVISYQVQNIKDIHYLGEFTVVFMCSTCYPKELLDIVYDKLKDSKNIRAVVTHKEFDRFKDFLPKTETCNFPCTWSKTLTWNIYFK